MSVFFTGPFVAVAIKFLILDDLKARRARSVKKWLVQHEEAIGVF